MTARTVIHVGDALAVLKTLPSESVQCIVTSPPYYGLRDYGTATWEGGDEGCDHVPSVKPRAERPRNGLTGGIEYMAAQEPVYRDTCGKCGATRIDDQLGLEPTPDEYVARLVAVFREARRVLRDDGVLWLNLGDSYAANGGAHGGRVDNQQGVGARVVHLAGSGDQQRRVAPGNLKPKDLIGIPWRVAFALQADGWWLRSDCIWHKPNPMPESVTDRPTKAHEYVFLLSKSARYFYDADAVKEDAASDHPSGNGFQRPARLTYQNGDGTARGNVNQWVDVGGTRNRRTVWTITPQPYSGAHFATMPPDLVEVCVKAGSAVGDTILDPFGGAGTTGLVANRLDRDAVLIELNADYAEMARERIYGDAPMFANVEVTTMQTDMIYWCPDCDIREHIDNLVSGCPNCGQTMIPVPPAEADTEVTP